MNYRRTRGKHHHTKLMRRRRPLLTDRRNGLSIVRLKRRSPKVATALVDALREALP